MWKRTIPAILTLLLLIAPTAFGEELRGRDIQDFVVKISRDAVGFLHQAGATMIAVEPIKRADDGEDYAFSEVLTGRLIEELSYMGKELNILPLTNPDALFRVTGTWQMTDDSIEVSIRILKMPAGKMEIRYTGSIPVAKVPKVYLSAKKAEKSEPDEGVRIAVMDFTGSGKWPSLDHLKLGIPEAITTLFATKSDLVMIERLQLDKIMTELKLSESHYADPEMAVEVGKLLGANYMIIGSYQKHGRMLRIMARRVKVETGEIFEAASQTGKERDLFELEDKVALALLDDIQKYR